MLPIKAPLIGRDEEIKEIEDALLRADHGVGSVALLSGEAGVGKTRLQEEVRRAHEKRGGRAVVGRGFPEDAGISFGPLADALRSARRARSLLWNSAKARAGLMSGVLPELANEETGQPEESFDRPVLFEALLDVVEDAGADRAFLWVLEDIHWADDSTWEFVKYATRRVADTKLVLVATYREEEVGPTHAWWTRLSWLKRDPSVITIRLGRLGAADSEFLVRTLAPSLSAELVASIIERSAGTPLLVEELASLAAKGGELPPVPEVVRATVVERAGRLGKAARDLLDVAAVAGLDVNEEVLASLPPECSAGDLVVVGLLEREDGVTRFRHPLLREAAYQEIQPAHRRALHEELAAELEKRGHNIERVASHLELAARPDAALAAIEAAAEEGRTAGDVGRAASLALVALAIAGRHETLKARQRELMSSAIGDLFRAGRWSELDPLVRRAWADRGELAATQRAWLASVMALHLFWSGEISEAAALVEEEVHDLERREGADQAAMLLAQASFIAWFCGDTDQALPLAERALGAARGLGDPEALCRARNVHYLANYQLDHDRLGAVARHRENAALARANGLTFAEANSLWSLSHYTATLEDYEAAERAAERAGTWYAAPARLLKGFMHLIEGRVDEAERIFVRIGPEIRLGIPAMAYWMDVKEAWLYLHRGDLDQARSILEERSETPGARLVLWATEASAARGWLAWEEGKFKEAADHFDRAIEEWPLGAYHMMVGGPVLLPLQVDALLRLTKRKEAINAIERGTFSERTPERFFAAALSAARFRLDPSIESADEADRLAATARWPWLRALVGLWRGELLSDTDSAREARDLLEEIGARRGVERADAVLRALGVRISRTSSGARTITGREMEVAKLVAEGFSNPAIARRLFLSRPTVASHVAHILTKLDFSSRAQIAAWVAEEGRVQLDEEEASSPKSST